MTAARRPRAAAQGVALALVLLAVAAFGTFAALGTWQVARRAWKLDLIERVNQRVHAPPVAAPGADRWATVSATSDEYRHVRVTGRYLPAADTWVKAVTERGSGSWVITPLRQADGSFVLVNRGFVADGRSSPAATAADPGPIVTVDGLLRISEPGGGFLRSNDAAGNRWFSRDVQAIAAARALSPVAPYFIDAQASPSDAADGPVAGLTVISFHNNHLVYALTWYALALMVAGAGWYLVRLERKPGGPDAAAA